MKMASAGLVSLGVRPLKLSGVGEGLGVNVGIIVLRVFEKNGVGVEGRSNGAGV